MSRIAYSTSFLWIAFFVIVIWSWAGVFDMSTAAGLDWIGRPFTDKAMLPHSFFVLCLMWAIMMIAMMLPTLVPALQSYGDLIKSANGTPSGWLGFVVGYAAVWILVSIVFAAMQTGLFYLGWIDMLGISGVSWFSVILFLLVGTYQFTRIKEYCQDICLSPMNYFLANWSPGLAGGIFMGIGIGWYCVVCCWGFMALGFVGGVMSLLWMGLATFIMILEKLPQVGRVIRKPLGGMFVLAGLSLTTYNIFYLGD